METGTYVHVMERKTISTARPVTLLYALQDWPLNTLPQDPVKEASVPKPASKKLKGWKLK